MLMIEKSALHQFSFFFFEVVKNNFFPFKSQEIANIFSLITHLLKLKKISLDLLLFIYFFYFIYCENLFNKKVEKNKNKCSQLIWRLDF